MVNPYQEDLVSSKLFANTDDNGDETEDEGPLVPEEDFEDEEESEDEENGSYYGGDY